MACVKQCDACGRVYIRNRAFEMSNDGGYVAGIMTINAAGRKDHKYDLCDDCLERLWEWLGEPRKDPVVIMNATTLSMGFGNNTSKPIDDGGWEQSQKEN